MSNNPQQPSTGQESIGTRGLAGLTAKQPDNQPDNQPNNQPNKQPNNQFNVSLLKGGVI